MDDKGPSIWDTFCHEGGRLVFEGQSGDITCNSYELWEEDLRCIRQLGLTHYRLSLSWSRLLPEGITRHVNQKGSCTRVGWGETILKTYLETV